ncbi:MAG: leucine--tRNA ligase [Opitutaceae bacterium]|nr:leucine--tRNA ligase [Opitutaceae bacterium]
MDQNSPDYEFTNIEPTWQKYWDEHKTFKASEDTSKPKYYILDMFPYPSGAGLHVGHPLGFVATDIFARYKRMKGFNVLHTMGFDAFGLPAEQYAIEHGVHPAISTEKNIANMRRQLYQLGLAHDKERSISTTETSFYRWTQWIFTLLYDCYCDPEEQKAKPISDLLAALEAGTVQANTETKKIETSAEQNADVWNGLSDNEKTDFISSQRLAYMSELPVNWCPELGTVLANEEVTNQGRSERGNFPVYKRPLHQWMLRITTFAERLLEDLSLVDWPEPIKMMQRNWIGKSEGTEILFELDAIPGEKLRVFTTRADTLFGATYMVLAPEHPLLDTITTDDQKASVETYIASISDKSDLERTDLAKDKTGIFTGNYALNPVNGKSIPIWVADYVLMSYGSGAIMAVPAHDERDFEFATKFDIPITQVIEPFEKGDAQELPYSGEGRLINSEGYTGMSFKEAGLKITQDLEEKGCGKLSIQYKLRDWLFSRQRYWGEPFPILHGEDGEIIPVGEDQLPVELPPMEDFRPRSYSDPDTLPTPPLGRATEDWTSVERDGKTYRRELNTMPQWAGSCWYYLRYIDPTNSEAFCSPEKEKYWMGENGVDLYVGGAEHAVLHLLYARFWHKVLYDLGHVSTKEPFGKLFNQGYIQAAAFVDERGRYAPATEIEEKDGDFFYQGAKVKREFGKMGKSLKNSVSPDEVCQEYGADTLRLYLMFLGPLESMKPWSSKGIEGVHRFLRKIWREIVAIDGKLSSKITDGDETDAETTRLLQETIKKVTEDVEALRFNTAISQMMIFANHLQKVKKFSIESVQTLLQLLSPFAPHMAEELWNRLGATDSISLSQWPSFDPSKLETAEVRVVFQINGKFRGNAMVPRDASQEDVVKVAQADKRVIAHLAGKEIRKIIYIPGKIINFVVG